MGGLQSGASVGHAVLSLAHVPLSVVLETAVGVGVGRVRFFTGKHIPFSIPFGSAMPLVCIEGMEIRNGFSMYGRVSPFFT